MSRSDKEIDGPETSVANGLVTIQNLKKSRGTHKRKITLMIKNLQELLETESLSRTLCKSLIEKVEAEMTRVKHLDDEINSVMDEVNLERENDELYSTEIKEQVNYLLQVELEIDQFVEISREPQEVNVSQNTVSSEDFKTMLSKLGFEGKPPPLECSTFSGKEKDKFAFSSFWNQFNNVIGIKKNMSDATKLAYLVGYLRDYALSVVKHLSITDANYEVAVQMLKQEFLDEEFLIDETYKFILKAAPTNTFDSEFTSTKIYLNEIRSYLSELKTCGHDFLEPSTPGHSLISHIVFNKLPSPVKREFIHRLGKNYPTIGEIFENYLKVLTTLAKTCSVRPKVTSQTNKSAPPNSKFTPSSSIKSADFKENKFNPSKGTMHSYKFTNSKLSCKLCGAVGHSMGQCNEYTHYEARVARLKQLSSCTRCAGSGHQDSNCYGKQGKLRWECKICRSKEHITPLCPSEGKSNPKTKSNVSLCLAQRSIDSCHLLPTMTLRLKNGRLSRKVRCLIDTGSQRSYLSTAAAKHLCPDVNELYSLDCEVSTYIGQQTKAFKQMATGVQLSDRTVFVPLLVDDELDVKFEVPGLNAVVGNFKHNKIELLDENFNNTGGHEEIKVDMLLGIDTLQYMSLSWENRLGGTCLVINGKAAPVGNILNFLNPKQRKTVVTSLRNTKETLSSKTKTIVNAVMDPIKSYFNPIEHILEDTEVENGLEHLFSLESMGIKTSDQELMSLETDQIRKFQSGITFQDGHYGVELPWYQDKVETVPSNHFVALKVLDRTLEHLERKGLTERYQAVFDQQLEDGIIEEIKVSPHQYGEKIWIPHRPVIKEEEQVTTKIRPVFNCSLKTDKHLPSLNEAAYPGVDLMNNILQLLFYFRTNQYVMLSDVKQAFLMIKLNKEADQNRFCFFWKRGSKLVTYRFKTIVFGFTSSPFMLHYVMKHHAKTFPDDQLTKILSNNFYVDNLLITGNQIKEMEDSYQLTYDRMKTGGFTLRSWNSNSAELRNRMAEDHRLVEHTSDEERVLGYRYNIKTDSLHITPCKINSEANTKRKVLSQTSKIFDPLNFALPVTVRGKILMRKIWQLQVGWDDPLPKEICTEMKSLSKDLEMLTEISYPRQALNEQHSYGVHVFCDSSAEAYGFVAYAVDEKGRSTYLHSKSRLAPLNRRHEHSIPTLELMGVILAFKCMTTILEAYQNIQIQFINICVDAQVVLNWLLTKDTKVKSKFLKNRILEADELNTKISEKFRISTTYHYVNTVQNPADMVTKGLSYNKYLKEMKFWLEGPTWLTNDFHQWPQYPLLSVSPAHKGKICMPCALQPIKVNTGVININKYSSLEALLRSTACLFKFLQRIKDCDPKSKALDYWVKVAQAECLQNELEFLKDKSNVKEKQIPPLVSDLNLFLDEKGVIRSRGRITKCLYYKYEVHNPILLPKGHRLTTLIINACHLKMQHLGIGTTLNYLREQGYWVPKGRQAVKHALSTCSVCKRYNTLAYKYPKYTDMPKHHVNLVKPFQHVGVDFTGHFWVRDEISDQSVKAYVLVFTCLNIRAVHFELLPDMSTKNFLLAFQRFCNLYSIPQYLYSDNAKAFIKGGDALEQSLISKEVQGELEKANIKHVKIPLYSAWIGSAWERLIRVLKSCLYKAIGRAKLTYFELLTTLTNIQFAINSRPLTYRGSSDELEAITPNSFLKINEPSSLVLRSKEEAWLDDQSQPQLEKALEMQEEIFENFKKLWYESYLLSLRERSRNLYQTSWENKIKVGDVVLIKSINKPRPFWLLGMVLRIVPGLDGKIRTVQLKQSNGQIEYHSICNLYPLELTITHAGKKQPPAERHLPLAPVDSGQGGQTETQSTRPKRKATERFRKMMREDLDYL